MEKVRKNKKNTGKLVAAAAILFLLLGLSGCLTSPAVEVTPTQAPTQRGQVFPSSTPLPPTEQPEPSTVNSILA